MRYVAQIDRAMSVYSRNKKARKERAGIDMARTKKARTKAGLVLFTVHMYVLSIRVVLAAI